MGLRHGAWKRWVVAGVLPALIGVPAAAAAQEPSPSSAPPTPVPSVEPEPSPEPSPQPAPSPAEPTPQATTAPPSTPPSPEAAPVSPSPAPAAPEPEPAPAPRTRPTVPVLDRTAPRDTTELVDTLAVLTEWGLPLEDVLAEGMGRVPVSGYASWSDDWLVARNTPDFHLHRGLDLLAERGTPVRSPVAGVVVRFGDRYPGGTTVRIRDNQGVEYYFAHLDARAPGLEPGQNVELGTLLGFVGDTGNAAGGPPHLHLEIERGGTTIPPKPIVDGWLDEALTGAGDFLEHRRLRVERDRKLLLGDGGPEAGLVAALLRMIVDPVGGVLSVTPRAGGAAAP